MDIITILIITVHFFEPFSTSFFLGSPGSRWWPICFLVRALFLACRWSPHCVLTWSFHCGVGRECSGVSSSYKWHRSYWIKAQLLWSHLTLITAIKTPSPNTVTLRWLQIWILRGHTWKKIRVISGLLFINFKQGLWPRIHQWKGTIIGPLCFGAHSLPTNSFFYLRS